MSKFIKQIQCEEISAHQPTSQDWSDYCDYLDSLGWDEWDDEPQGDSDPFEGRGSQPWDGDIIPFDCDIEAPPF